MSAVESSPAKACASSEDAASDELAEVLGSPDLAEAWTYIDAGTRNERVSQIDFSSAIHGRSYRKSFTYAIASGRYYLTSVQWSEL